jgi:hypothetical protein
MENYNSLVPQDLNVTYDQPQLDAPNVSFDVGDSRTYADMMNAENPVSPGSGIAAGGNDSFAQAMGQFIDAPASIQTRLEPIRFDWEKSGIERYQNSDYYDTLGFDLTRDNETLYGRMQTVGDTLQQGFGQMGELAWNGFVDGWKGWGRLAAAVTNADMSRLMGTPAELEALEKETQRIMNKYAIFETPESKDSLFTKQFMGNMLGQSGFALGAIAQWASEELLTFGASTAFSSAKLGLKLGQFANMTRKLGRAYEMPEVLNDFRKLFEIGHMPGAMKTAMQGLGKVAEYAPVVGGLVKAGKDFKRMKEAGATGIELANLSLGALRRTFTETNMAMAEARMEAASTYVQMKEDMTARAEAIWGDNIPLDEFTKIERYAERAALENFKVNAVVIATMNRIEFGNVMNKFGSRLRIKQEFLNDALQTRRVKGSLKSDMLDSAGKVVKKAGSQTDMLFKADGVMGQFGSIGQIAKTFGKQKAAWEATKMVGGSLMKWEGTEGLQELIQSGSNEAITDYYRSLYDPYLFADRGESIERAVASQNPLTHSEALKTFIMGAGTGRLLSPINMGMSAAAKYAKTTKEQRADAAKQLDTAINEMNVTLNDPASFFNDWVKGVRIQDQAAKNMEEALANNDKYTFHNNRDSAFAQMVMNAKALGRLDMLKDVIGTYGETMDAATFKDAFGVELNDQNRDALKSFTGNIIKDMDAYVKRYDELMEKYRFYFDPEAYGDEDKEDVKLARMALNEAIGWMATTDALKDKKLERAREIMESSAQMKSFSKVSVHAFKVLGDDIAYEAEMDHLKKEIKSLREVQSPDPETKKQLAEKEKELELLSNMFSYQESMDSDGSTVNKGGITAESVALMNARKELNDAELALYEYDKQTKNANTFDGLLFSAVRTNMVARIDKAREKVKAAGEKRNGSKKNIDNAKKKRSIYEDNISKEALRQYLALKNKEYGETQEALEEELDGILYNLRDYARLNRDAKDATNNLNMMANPLKFGHVAARIKSGLTGVYQSQIKRMAIINSIDGIINLVQTDLEIANNPEIDRLYTAFEQAQLATLGKSKDVFAEDAMFEAADKLIQAVNAFVAVREQKKKEAEEAAKAAAAAGDAGTGAGAGASPTGTGSGSGSGSGSASIYTPAEQILVDNYFKFETSAKTDPILSVSDIVKAFMEQAVLKKAVHEANPKDDALKEDYLKHIAQVSEITTQAIKAYHDAKKAALLKAMKIESIYAPKFVDFWNETVGELETQIELAVTEMRQAALSGTALPSVAKTLALLKALEKRVLDQLVDIKNPQEVTDVKDELKAYLDQVETILQHYADDYLNTDRHVQQLLLIINQPGFTTDQITAYVNAHVDEALVDTVLDKVLAELLRLQNENGNLSVFGSSVELVEQFMLELKGVLAKQLSTYQAKISKFDEAAKELREKIAPSITKIVLFDEFATDVHRSVEAANRSTPFSADQVAAIQNLWRAGLLTNDEANLDEDGNMIDNLSYVTASGIINMGVGRLLAVKMSYFINQHKAGVKLSSVEQDDFEKTLVDVIAYNSGMHVGVKGADKKLVSKKDFYETEFNEALQSLEAGDYDFFYTMYAVPEETDISIGKLMYQGLNEIYDNYFKLADAKTVLELNALLESPETRRVFAENDNATGTLNVLQNRILALVYRFTEAYKTHKIPKPEALEALKDQIDEVIIAIETDIREGKLAGASKTQLNKLVRDRISALINTIGQTGGTKYNTVIDSANTVIMSAVLFFNSLNLEALRLDPEYQVLGQDTSEAQSFLRDHRDQMGGVAAEPLPVMMRKAPVYTDSFLIGNVRDERDTRTAAELQAEIFGSLQSGQVVDFSEIIRALRRSPFTTGLERKLMSTLANIPNFPIRVIFSGTDRNSFEAEYPSIKNDVPKITLNLEELTGPVSTGVGASPNTVIFHELLHGVLWAVLENKNAPYTQRMESLMKLVQKSIPNPQRFYSLSDVSNFGEEANRVHEFVIEALTNPLFQEELAKIESDENYHQKASLWERFIDALAEIFRYLTKDGVENSVLDEVFGRTYAHFLDMVDQGYMPFDEYQAIMNPSASATENPNSGPTLGLPAPQPILLLPPSSTVVVDPDAEQRAKLAARVNRQIKANLKAYQQAYTLIHSGASIDEMRALIQKISKNTSISKTARQHLIAYLDNAIAQEEFRQEQQRFFEAQKEAERLKKEADRKEKAKARAEQTKRANDARNIQAFFESKKGTAPFIKTYNSKSGQAIYLFTNTSSGIPMVMRWDRKRKTMVPATEITQIEWLAVRYHLGNNAGGLMKALIDDKFFGNDQARYDEFMKYLTEAFSKGDKAVLDDVLKNIQAAGLFDVFRNKLGQLEPQLQNLPEIQKAIRDSFEDFFKNEVAEQMRASKKKTVSAPVIPQQITTGGALGTLYVDIPRDESRTFRNDHSMRSFAVDTITAHDDEEIVDANGEVKTVHTRQIGETEHFKQYYHKIRAIINALSGYDPQAVSYEDRLFVKYVPDENRYRTDGSSVENVLFGDSRGESGLIGIVVDFMGNPILFDEKGNRLKSLSDGFTQADTAGGQIIYFNVHRIFKPMKDNPGKLFIPSYDGYIQSEADELLIELNNVKMGITPRLFSVNKVSRGYNAEFNIGADKKVNMQTSNSPEMMPEVIDAVQNKGLRFRVETDGKKNTKYYLETVNDQGEVVFRTQVFISNSYQSVGLNTLVGKSLPEHYLDVLRVFHETLNRSKQHPFTKAELEDLRDFFNNLFAHTNPGEAFFSIGKPIHESDSKYTKRFFTDGFAIDRSTLKAIENKLGKNASRDEWVQALALHFENNKEVSQIFVWDNTVKGFVPNQATLEGVSKIKVLDPATGNLITRQPTVWENFERNFKRVARAPIVSKKVISQGKINFPTIIKTTLPDGSTVESIKFVSRSLTEFLVIDNGVQTAIKKFPDPKAPFYHSIIEFESQKKPGVTQTVAGRAHHKGNRNRVVVQNKPIDKDC